MSWSCSKQVTAPSELDGLQPDYEINEAVKQQVWVAVEAAKLIISSGAVGPDGTNLSVSLSGHANENHAPHEAITVTVAQA
ncbi:MAG TPA: hypothetical protein VF944_09360 [Candidatus Bathyarchaeia archaeon]